VQSTQSYSNLTLSALKTTPDGFLGRASTADARNRVMGEVFLQLTVTPPGKNRQKDKGAGRSKNIQTRAPLLEKLMLV
jgi:hypothetical protein